MFMPFGESLITQTSAPSSSSAFLAVTEEAPFAQSIAIFIPSKTVSQVVSANLIYLSTKESSIVICPIFLPIGDSIFSELSRIIDSILFSISSLSLYPEPLKYLIPLCSKGLCDADIITPASKPSLLTRWAIAGVGITPARTASAPTLHIPATKADSKIPPDILVSLPTNILGLSPQVSVKT